MPTEAKNPPGLLFDEDTHTYTYNGITVPSVKEIMRPLTKKVYGEINLITLNRAADRGTRVHRAIQFWGEFKYKNTDEETEPYFDQFMKFSKELNVEILKSEFRLFHKRLLYAGTADLLVSENGLGPVLVDIKTTRTIHEGLLSVQLAAYKEAAKWCGYDIKRTAVLLISKDGYTFRDIEPDFGMFLNCLSIYRFKP